MSKDVTDLAAAVPASEFTRNFWHYRTLAQREPVVVSSDGKITGYFLCADDYEEFKRFKASRRSFATSELPADKAAAIAGSRMDSRHRHLDAMLDPE